MTGLLERTLSLQLATLNLAVGVNHITPSARHKVITLFVIIRDPSLFETLRVGINHSDLGP